MTANFFSPLSFVAVFRSGIRDPGWVKIRIRIRNTDQTLPLHSMNESVHSKGWTDLGKIFLLAAG
jgi:hypothetical protein